MQEQCRQEFEDICRHEEHCHHQKGLGILDEEAEVQLITHENKENGNEEAKPKRLKAVMRL